MILYFRLNLLINKIVTVSSVMEDNKFNVIF